MNTQKQFAAFILYRARCDLAELQNRIPATETVRYRLQKWLGREPTPGERQTAWQAMHALRASGEISFRTNEKHRVFITPRPEGR